MPTLSCKETSSTVNARNNQAASVSQAVLWTPIPPLGLGWSAAAGMAQFFAWQLVLEVFNLAPNLGRQGRCSPAATAHKGEEDRFKDALSRICEQCHLEVERPGLSSLLSCLISVCFLFLEYSGRVEIKISIEYVVHNRLQLQQRRSRPRIAGLLYYVGGCECGCDIIAICVSRNDAPTTKERTSILAGRLVRSNLCGKNPGMCCLEDQQNLTVYHYQPWILAQLGISLSAIHDGFGHHLSVLPITDLTRIAKDEFIIYFLYDAGLVFTKASALCFLRRIFPREASPRWFNACFWLGHGFNIIWLIGVFFGTLFHCAPIAKNWNTTLSGHCLSTSSLFIGSAVPSVFIDLFILILPLPRLLTLHVSMSRRIGIIIVFMLGYS